MNIQTKTVDATAPKQTLEQLNALLDNLDSELKQACECRAEITDKIENIKAERAEVMKQMIEAHREKVKALSSEVPRKTRADKGSKNPETKA